jgi:hypothetical protein
MLSRAVVAVTATARPVIVKNDRDRRRSRFLKISEENRMPS